MDLETRTAELGHDDNHLLITETRYSDDIFTKLKKPKKIFLHQNIHTSTKKSKKSIYSRNTLLSNVWKWNRTNMGFTLFWDGVSETGRTAKN